MTTHMQQTITTRWAIVRSIAVGIMGLASVVGIGAMLLSSHPQPPTIKTPLAMIATNPVLGVDAPPGADLANLPAGYTDYIYRTPHVFATNPVLGVDAPAGVDVQSLPAGYRDYIRSNTAGLLVVTNPVLGIDLPTGAVRAHLPTGLTDYLLPVESVVATNPVLGIDAPAGVDVPALPAGYRDYIRHP
jgi:hypothetical protein